MQKLALFGWIVGLLVVCSPLPAQEIRFPVRHNHVIGSCAGELIFRGDGVEYATHDKKHARVWKYEDIQQIGLLSPKDISILTYEDSKWMLGKDRAFHFKITKGEIAAPLWTMLQTKLTRPLVSAIVPPDIAPRYRIPAKHERGFAGSQGILEISDQYIMYKTETKQDSRIWRYEDISSIGTTGPYQLRLTSMDRTQGETGAERNFVFSLKQKLQPAIYDFIWWKINGPKISSTGR
jgi:hypothetical protein